MKRIKQMAANLTLVLGALMFVSLPVAVVGAPMVAAADPAPAATNPANQIEVGSKTPGLSGNLKTSIAKITNILLFVLGFIAVIVIVVGGIRYATSGGDSSQVKSAKDTILYAVVGLVVAILAYAIVNFVLGQFTTPTP